MPAASEPILGPRLKAPPLSLTADAGPAPKVPGARGLHSPHVFFFLIVVHDESKKKTVTGPSKDAENIAMDLLERVKIPEQALKYPGQLSGGQQQRVAIARALCMRPKIMLFDEPTSALDPELELEVVKVIRELAAEGRTMILVTHDMRLARDVSTHVMFLNQGVVEEQGTPEDVFGKPKTERLRQFLHATSPAA